MGVVLCAPATGAGALGVLAEHHELQPFTATDWLERRTSSEGLPMSFQMGDRVQVDIPDSDDPDHRYHGAAGEIEEVLQDDLSGITGDPRDDFLYQIAFEDEALGQMSFRHHDLDRVGTVDEER